MSNVFDTADYLDRFVGLHMSMARVSFPAPFTIADYRKWYRAMNLADMPDETDDVDQVVLLRQYRAAMAVATVEPYDSAESDGFPIAATPLPEESDEFQYDSAESDGFPIAATPLPEESDEFQFGVTEALAQYAPVDTAVIDPAYDDLPMPWVSFMVQAAEEYIGDRIITGVVGDRLTTQQRLDVLKRRMDNRYRLPSFNHNHVADLMPAINLHRGFVTYREPLTKSWYRRWVKETAVNKNTPVTDVNNGRFLRSLRGAVTLVQQFHFQNLKWTDLTAKDCEAMPMEIACFLVETCDEYLSRRMTVKN